jgi:hypothetical protein
VRAIDPVAHQIGGIGPGAGRVGVGRRADVEQAPEADRHGRATRRVAPDGPPVGVVAEGVGHGRGGGALEPGHRAQQVEQQPARAGARLAADPRAVGVDESGRGYAAGLAPGEIAGAHVALRLDVAPDGARAQPVERVVGQPGVVARWVVDQGQAVGRVVAIAPRATAGCPAFGDG